MRVAFVTKGASHYRVKTFDTLAKYYDVQYLFSSGGEEWYWQRGHGTRAGKFDHEYLAGISVAGTRIRPSFILYLGSADVCICPLEDATNDRARWPAKILDFCSAARPVVTNDVGEVGELFRAQTIGVLAPHDDAGFADAIGALLDNLSVASELGERGRSVMVGDWDWTCRGPAVIAAVTGSHCAK
jgi:hypothetical protein